MRNNELNYFFQNLAQLKGVGGKSLGYLQKLFRKDINTSFKDLLFHLPHTIVKRQKNSKISGFEVGENIITKVEVLYTESVLLRGTRKKYFKVITKTEDSFLNLVFFNAKQQYLEDILPPNSFKTISGRLEEYKGKLQITHPNYILPASAFETLPEYEAVYPLTEGINNKFLRRLFAQILPKLPKIEEWQDKKFMEQSGFLSIAESLKNVHSPKTSKAISPDSKFRRRLEYDELLASQLSLALSRKVVAKQAGNKICNQGKLKREFLSSLGFSLTGAQIAAIKDVETDMESENRMFRLIQGDVGSGKTIIGIVTLLNAIEDNFQGAFMAPTEILARQQYESLNEVISKNEVLRNHLKPVLIVGSIKPAAKAKIQSEIAEGKYNLVFGTHALFQEKVSFKNLGAIVIDEQHRFGVKQRMQLAEKGGKVDVLLMTATPIPRTLSMTLYGDMDISIVAEKPAGRKPIETRIMPVTKASELIVKLKKSIEEENSQIYWVCPAVEENEDLLFNSDDKKLAAAEEKFKELKKAFGDNVVLVHGKLKADEKNKAVAKFKQGQANIMVATTVIEVGVNVPTANIIIIENAEMFGLSQLHQLRGRVGRGSQQSSCVLLYGKTLSENGAERLKILRETEDGFKIAEEDMVLRGSGDLLGTKQSGMPDFRIATLPENKDLLFAARDDVKIILNQDPELKTERGRNLRNLLYLFEYDNQIANLNA